MDAMRVGGEEQLRSAAARETKAVMVRLAKGEVAMRLEVWRSQMKAWVMTEGDALRASPEAAMRTGRHEAAVRQMSMVMAGTINNTYEQLTISVC